jgi:PAS domain S-box-containing protein
MFALAHDIHKRVRAEEAAKDAFWRLESVIEGTNVGTWEWNVQTGETVFSERWAGILGYTLQELGPVSIATWEKFAHPEDLKASGELLERHFSGELPYYDCDCRMRHKDGRWVWVHDRGRVITRDAEGKPLMMFGTHTDIDLRKRDEEALRRALIENQNLLGELQHRAKNSFNMILAMIGLASGEGCPPEVKTALEELSSRVSSVSELYGLLYATGNFSEVPLADYCARVAAPLVSLSEHISFDAKAESISVPPKKAAPIGLILTELITNAIKYAFPDGRAGRIAITLRRTDSGALLEVEDDGVGLPEGFEPSAGGGMGLKLILGLAAQVHGSFRMEGGSGGTRGSLEFPI